MADAFFSPAGEGRYGPTGHLPGPWHPGMMHGGPPSALMAHRILDFAQGEKAPGDPLLSRLVVEFVRPVPVEEVEVSCRLVRPGRRVALVEAVMTAGGDEVMRANGWLSRIEGVPVPDTGRVEVPPEVPLETIDPAGWSSGYLQSVEWGWVEGRFEEPGPATVWARPKYPLVEGRETRPEELVALIVDSGSGVSAVASPKDLIFVNVDMAIHLLRRPVGDSIWMRSETLLDPEGTGITTTVIGDREGQVGVAAQSLFVAPA
ncbi:MAG: thioesterase family protein [Solirubrobacterales bacterium]